MRFICLRVSGAIAPSAPARPVSPAIGLLGLSEHLFRKSKAAKVSTSPRHISSSASTNRILFSPTGQLAVVEILEENALRPKVGVRSRPALDFPPV
jgi:hypothetical protein